MKITRALRIATREGRAIVGSPAGTLIVGTFWLVAGLLLITLLWRFRDGLFQVARSTLQTEPQGLHINDWVIRPLLYNVGTVLIFFVPLLTMRSFAEERRSGNLELLMSQPIRGAELLLGKSFGVGLSLLACLSVFLIHGVVLALVSTPDWPATAVGFLGLTLLGLLFVSVGVFLSVLSRSQVEAAVLSLGGLLLLVVGPNSVTTGPRWVQETAAFFSVLGRFEDFTRGILDFGHVAFFLGVSFILLAMALRGLDLVRWQG